MSPAWLRLIDGDGNSNSPLTSTVFQLSTFKVGLLQTFCFHITLTACGNPAQQEDGGQMVQAAPHWAQRDHYHDLLHV